MFGVITFKQNQTALGIDRDDFDHGKASFDAASVDVAGTGYKPPCQKGKDANNPQHKQQGGNKPEIGAQFHQAVFPVDNL
jgi:hypothetical protein